jgi:hypothetical protein
MRQVLEELLTRTEHRISEVRKAKRRGEAKILTCAVEKDVKAYHELIGQEAQLAWIIEELRAIIFEQKDLF